MTRCPDSSPASLSVASDQVHSFDPILGDGPVVLILGSMPGRASLDARQYYAHPRNAFWRIMGEVFGFNHEDDYSLRCQVLREYKIAVWDVLQRCRRAGSLDSAIDSKNMVTNNFSAWFDAHPTIERVLLNGSKAYDLYRQKVFKTLAPMHQSITYYRLPSTSPAHARLNAAQKIEQWRPYLELTQPTDSHLRS